MRLDTSYQLESLHFFIAEGVPRPDFRPRALFERKMTIYVNFMPILSYFNILEIPYWLSPCFEMNHRIAERPLVRPPEKVSQHTGSTQGIARPNITENYCQKNAIFVFGI